MFCWHKGLSSRGTNASSKRFNSDSTDLEIKTATEPLPHASEATGSRSCDCSGDEGSLLPWDAGLLFHKGGKEEHAWGIGDALGCLLLSPRPVMVTWKQQLNVGRTANGPDSVGMRARVTPQSEVPAEGKRNAKWVLEEGSYRHQLRPQVTQTLQTGDTDPVSM